MLPKTRAGKLTTGFFILFTIVMNPPAILLVNKQTVIAGNALLYLWSVVWGLIVSLVLIWAAWRNAFAITEDQVPPELREDDEVTTAQTVSSEDTSTGGT